MNVEITPEMIAAGVKELATFDNRFDSLEDGVEAIFSAMIEASHQELPPQSK